MLRKKLLFILVFISFFDVYSQDPFVDRQVYEKFYVQQVISYDTEKETYSFGEDVYRCVHLFINIPNSENMENAVATNKYKGASTKNSSAFLDSQDIHSMEDGYENRQNKECKFLRLNNYINTQNSLDQMGNEFSGEAYLDSGEKVYIYHNFKSIETSAEHKYIRIYLYYSGFKYH